MGKFKAGSKVALDAVKANAANLAVAQDPPSVNFAMPKQLGRSKTSLLPQASSADATGLAVEDASRSWKQQGTSVFQLRRRNCLLVKLNKDIGADPDKVRDLGIDLVYLTDGSLDVNETLLNTIQRIKDIKDPAEKAKVATQVLGRSWQNMAELIEMGRRSAMDGLGDSIGDLQVKSGQRLIPLATMLANGATKVLEFDAAFDELIS
jgi:hypothetical protein